MIGPVDRRSFIVSAAAAAGTLALPAKVAAQAGGLDPDNSNAFDRAIVMHSADYCTPAHLERWGRLGRSNGCFAMAPDDVLVALTQLSGGRLIYADKLHLG